VPVDSPYLKGRDRYERRMDGWVDASHDDAFTLTAQLSDDDLGVEVRVVTTPSPGYEIREARCRILGGPADPGLAAAFPSLTGVRMVGGFTRRVAEVAGAKAGARLAVDAAIELARLARQVTKLPPEQAKLAAGADPWQCWQLDMTGWVDIPGSCFTYSEAGRALFGARPVTTPMTPDLYAPPPGKPRVFNRRKVARLERNGSRLSLFHSMFDEVHGFELRYEIDLITGTIVGAESATPRLPYMGICDEPQRKIQLLVGQPADPELRKRIQTLIGGSAGCAQLYDLTSDLIKLLTFT
jgi:hypothetical protein